MNLKRNASTVLCGAILCVLAATEAAFNVCSPPGGFMNVSKGELTYICVGFNDEYRAVYMPQVDQFTELFLKDSYFDENIKAQSGNGSYVTLSSGNASSFYKLYSSKKGKVFSVLTAIISVKEGQVQGITWDDGCYMCAKTSCEANTYSSPGALLSGGNYGRGESCYIPSSTCATNADQCGMLIYVGWTGTDKNGKYLSSAGLRFSQFQSYSIQSYVTSMKDRISSLV